MMIVLILCNIMDKKDIISILFILLSYSQNVEEEGGREDKDQNHIVCDYCGKEFDNSDKFKIHIDQVHSSSDLFQ